MPYNRLSTAKIAKAAGCHPNTVRLYEQLGLISPVARSPKGYRLYTPMHLDQMCLARLGLQGAFPGPNIRRSMFAIIKTTATQDFSAALELARRHLDVVSVERQQAEAAVVFLQRWARGETIEPQQPNLLIKQAAELLEVTVDKLRSWESNGLVRVPRSPSNGYRLYGEPEIGRLRVIRLLRQNGYSPMAVLRMLIEFDKSRGQLSEEDLRRALDTPRPDEDVYMAADRWISTLAEQEQRAHQIIGLVEDLLRKYGHIELEK